MVCTQCWLVQTEDFTGRENLFTEQYVYFSSFSSTWLAHARRFVEEMIPRFGLGADSTVVEIAANDGYLLQFVQRSGIACYGIEPTQSTAEAARAKGIEILREFFGADTGQRLAKLNRQADLVVANNVLAHVQDINDFVSGFPYLLKPDGVATFEFPHLLQMVKKNQFDTAYHEHYSYLSLTTVQNIFARNGLAVFDVEALPTHGGSLRVYAQQKGAGSHHVSPAVGEMLSAEKRLGMITTSFYRDMQVRADNIKHSLLSFLEKIKKQGKTVAAYGAAAKGNTLINYCGITKDLIGFVADASPHKQGKYLPGSHIPVVAEQCIEQEKPAYVLILPWNLKEEITRQLHYIRQWGGKFLVPIPQLEIV